MEESRLKLKRKTASTEIQKLSWKTVRKKGEAVALPLFCVKVQ